jgi:MEKHLA domain
MLGCAFSVYSPLRLEKTSGRGLFRRINDILWEEQLAGLAAESIGNSTTTTITNITTFEQLDKNTRFGVLSHGTQVDPIYNYGNCASLELFGYPLDILCQTPSRYSTVESLMEDRDQIIRSIESVGHGPISNALRVTSDGKLFVMRSAYLWNVYDDSGRRIGLAALYDRSEIRDYVEQSLQSVK